MKLDVNCDGAIQYRELHAKISEKISKDSVKKSKNIPDFDPCFSGKLH